jgi:hypothetical protein
LKVFQVGEEAFAILVLSLTEADYREQSFATFGDHRIEGMNEDLWGLLKKMSAQ